MTTATSSFKTACGPARTATKGVSARANKIPRRASNRLSTGQGASFTANKGFRPATKAIAGLTRSNLSRLYTSRELSIRTIATKLECGFHDVRDALIQHKIPRRSPGRPAGN